MPFKSEDQARFMRAVAHGWNKPGCGCADKDKCACSPTVGVAKKFVKEDGMSRQRKMADLLTD